MKAEDIKIDDFTRIFFGDAPPVFLIEVIIRFLIIFIILVVALRLSGKSQVLSRNRSELAALVSLAAAIGVPLQQPSRGLIPALIVAIVIVGIQRLVSLWAFSNEKFSNVVNGKYSTLVEDGVLQLKALRKIGLPKERIVASIRQSGIAHLGTIERLYMEADGTFTIIENKQAKPGLSMIPIWDREFRDQQKKAPNVQVCSQCGSPQPAGKQTCPVCSHNKWEEAIVS
ncbi:DUF421 domain-containing protein [Cytophagaceae bacterium DM2B3-1]|uniref:DUF421 domain-containing protein n=1 Tax=Xanthocytophaga flava TaxID=3048013 RepID=A0ABT7CIF2_9BACT|nr:YetF domain-containing protein [Xanthocytophaga flavus]MDJ1469565.1 DUF421 domain-containing protein [Xanthocytophaga flavus]MDJ1493511.1 DUF421 domain-containing protein [Xanthocytophaga flavus]